MWVDDAHFNLDYHVRHTALPPPGSMRQLKRLVGRVMSQKLDLSKPLWELWIVEGLEGGRFALVNKLHHCMVDGISAVNVLSAYFSPDPDAPARRPTAWHPRPVAACGRSGHWASCNGAPAGRWRWRAAWRGAGKIPRNTIAAIRDTRRRGGRSHRRESCSRRPRRRLNVDEVGPHRRVDWVRFDLDEVKAVKNRLGGKVNDVVLATVAAAMRRYLRGHRTPVDGLDFRVVVPISRRPTVGRRRARQSRRADVGAPAAGHP